MSYMQNYSFAKTISDSIVLAARGPHTRSTARIILQRLQELDNMTNQNKMQELLNILLRGLEANGSLIPEITRFIRLLQEEYKFGKQQGWY